MVFRSGWRLCGFQWAFSVGLSCTGKGVYEKAPGTPYRKMGIFVWQQKPGRKEGHERGIPEKEPGNGSVAGWS